MSADSPAAISFSINGEPTFVPSIGTPVLINTIGNTILHTPSSGKKIRLRWIGMKTPADNTTAVQVTLRLGTNNIYLWLLDRIDVFSHSTLRDGAINETLNITLSAAENVYVNFDLEEI